MTAVRWAEPVVGRPATVEEPVPSMTRPSGVLPAVALVVALGLWLGGLSLTSSRDLGGWGLLPAFSWLWYAGLAVNIGLIGWGLAGQHLPSNAWMAAHLTLTVLVLYGSASMVEDAPRLPWVYKHIAVARYLEVHGAVNPSVDIYQHWPGFFALAAQVGQLIGLPDPVEWAWVAEPGFGLLDALLVFAIARTISRDRRWCWTAVVLFVVTNWIGQNYFAPQALGYSLYLVICLLLLTAARSEPGRLAGFLERTAARVVGPRAARAGLAVRGPEADRATGGSRTPRWVAVAVLAAFAVIVVSHQLTPYLTLLAVVPLFLLRYFRPFWLAVAMTVIAIAYLAINLSYIQQHFGLFSGFDPVSNAVYTPVNRATLLPSAVWQARGTRVITLFMYLVALVGLVRRARAGAVRSALVVAWLMLSPGLILAGQTYGGEGRLRSFLFSLPWCAMAAAWAFWPGRRPPHLVVRGILVAAVTCLTALFVTSYFAQEADLRIPRAEVSAAQYLDGSVTSGDIILPISPTFPLLVGPHYDKISPTIALPDAKQFFPENLTVANLLTIATNNASAGNDTYHVFVVFSDNGYRYSARHDLFAPGELTGLEAEVTSRSGTVRVYDSGPVRIYRLR